MIAFYTILTEFRDGKSFRRVAEEHYVAKVRPCLVISIPALDQDRPLATLIPHTTSSRGSRFEVKIKVKFLREGVFDVQNIIVMKKIAKARMTQAFIEVLGVYNEIALLINSCHLAKDKYESINNPDFRLSTTQGIPPEYQLPDLEIEFLYKANELTEQ